MEAMEAMEAMETMSNTNILQIWKKKILFGYYCSPAVVFPEMENAGFSFRLFPNGRVIWQTYFLNRKKGPMVKHSGMMDISEDSVSKISRILAGYAKETDDFPEFINNGTCDGSFNDFVFCGKFVSLLNIRYNDMAQVMRENPKYYEEFRFDMADENKVLAIFTGICDVLRADGIELYLYHLKIADEKII